MGKIGKIEILLFINLYKQYTNLATYICQSKLPWKYHFFWLALLKATINTFTLGGISWYPQLWLPARISEPSNHFPLNFSKIMAFLPMGK